MKFILVDSFVRSRLFTEASNLRAGLKREACWGVPQFETKRRRESHIIKFVGNYRVNILVGEKTETGEDRVINASPSL